MTDTPAAPGGLETAHVNRFIAGIGSTLFKLEAYVAASGDPALSGLVKAHHEALAAGQAYLVENSGLTGVQPQDGGQKGDGGGRPQ